MIMPTAPKKPAPAPKTTRLPKRPKPNDTGVKKIAEQGEPFEGNFA
jgi:hypothetical protein